VCAPRARRCDCALAVRMIPRRAAAELHVMRNLIGVVFLWVVTLPTSGQVLLVGPPCERYTPEQSEIEAILRRASSVVPPGASLVHACASATNVQVRPGVMRERATRSYEFVWATGVSFGSLEHWLSATCTQDVADAVSCEVDGKGVRKNNGTRIETHGELSDPEIVEVLAFMETRLGEEDTRSIAKLPQTGRVNWSSQVRTFGVEVLKDSWRAQYRLTHTCSSGTKCEWHTEGPTGVPIP